MSFFDICKKKKGEGLNMNTVKGYHTNQRGEGGRGRNRERERESERERERASKRERKGVRMRHIHKHTYITEEFGERTTFRYQKKPFYHAVQSRPASPEQSTITR